MRQMRLASIRSGPSRAQPAAPSAKGQGPGDMDAVETAMGAISLDEGEAERLRHMVERAWEVVDVHRSGA